MNKRANYLALAPKAMKILISQENYLNEQFSACDTVTITTWELVKLRISQINQCAYCIDMHSKIALGKGETKERIFGLSAWRDMPIYSKAEIVALEWAENITEFKPVSEQSYLSTIEVLGEQALVDLTIAINAINSWNRLAKTFKSEVSSH